ncbi:hypothetical protein KQI65_06190 [bacterium]|nr:hypothetical protein [bacterium]
MQTFVGKKKELFDFMRENDFPVYHASNIFYRDLQYAIRDYIRVHEGKDIGTRKMEELAREFVADLEREGILKPFARNTWLLNDVEYLLPSQVEEETPAAEAETA